MIRHHAASGYKASADLLTRRSEDRDVATDVCVRRKGRNPATGRRHVALDAAQRTRIENCDDLEELQRWLFRATEIHDAADLLR